jgi:hypothetical protein
MFFKLPVGGIKAGRNFDNQGECELHISAFKDDIPKKCVPLTYAYAPCTPVACVQPLEPLPPAPPPAVKPEPQSDPPPAPKPDPAAFREVSVGPTDLKEADKPFLEERPPTVRPADLGPKPKPKVRTARQQQFDPFGAIIAMFVPGRDW